MGYDPFRPSYTRELFGDWAPFVVIALLAVGCVLGLLWCDDQAQQDCRRKGGQYVRVYKSALCVKKGSVIE